MLFHKCLKCHFHNLHFQYCYTQLIIGDVLEMTVFDYIQYESVHLKHI